SSDFPERLSYSSYERLRPKAGKDGYDVARTDVLHVSFIDSSTLNSSVLDTSATSPADPNETARRACPRPARWRPDHASRSAPEPTPALHRRMKRHQR